MADVTNATEAAEVKTDDLHPDLDPIYAAVEVICALLAIVENFFVVVLFVRDRSLRTVKNYYVLSLATADLLVGLFGVPSALALSVGLPRPFRLCLVTTSLLVALCTASIASLVAVTVDRFWAIVLPLDYPAVMTPSRARGFIAAAWAVAAGVGALPSLGWNRGAPRGEARCFFTEVTDPGYLVFIYFATIVGPSVFMAVLYAVIFRTVQLQGRRLSELLTDDETNHLSRDHHHHHHHHQQQQQQLLLQRQLATESSAARSIAIVVVVFLVSWIPLYTVNAVSYFCPSACIVPDWLLKTTIVLSHLNSVWNPLIYAWGMHDFRSSLRRQWPNSSERNRLIKK